MLDKLGQTGEPRQESAKVRVMGNKASGKTTYMAALVRWPNADPESPVQTVTSMTEPGHQLFESAKNLLEQGASLEPTSLVDVDQVKDYSLRILLKDRLGMLAMNVSCKDYAGEFFEDILRRRGAPILDDYVQDCLQADGLMLLIDGTSYRRDDHYASGMKNLLVELDRGGDKIEERRIALVLTKCEQVELWQDRHKPAKMVTNLFPKVQQQLQNWQPGGTGKINFFASSAFGMLGNRYPEPNMRPLESDRYGLKSSVLKNARCWQPFGLVAPIYWLCTGKRHGQLDRQ